MQRASEPDKLLYREAAIDPAAVKADSREVELSFASEQPVTRFDWDTGKTYAEVLDATPKSADFSRLNNGGALLRDHNRTLQTGVVVRGSAKVDADRKSRATVKFSRSKAGEEEFQDVRDGIRTLVSVGYQTGREISRETVNGIETRRFEWMAYEVSIVSIPADTSVGVGRDKEPLIDSLPSLNADEFFKTATPEQKQRMKILLDPAPAAGGGGPATVDEKKLREDWQKSERERTKNISDIGDLLIKDHGNKNDGKMADQIRGLVRAAIGSEQSVSDFQVKVMQEVLGAKPAKLVRMADLGFDEREQNSYSLVRAIQSCIKRESKLPDPDTIEGEAHVRMAKLDLGYSTKGFLVPADANISARSLSRFERRQMQRDLTAGVFGQGGATVATEVVLPIIELLRNRMVTDKLGIRTMAGLQGNVVIPRQTAAATAYSVPEIGALTLSTQALDQIALTPHRVGAWNNYSKQLLLQSSIDVENFIRDDLIKVIALDWDRIILNGAGGGSEPTGVINTPGVGSITFGGAATYAKLVAMETAIAVLNAPVDNRAYATTSAAKGILKSAARLLVGATTVTAVALWENDMINGYTAIDSQQVPSNLMLFGAWSEIILGLWGGYDVVIDNYTLATQAEIRIVVNTWGDVAVRHPQSFCISSDSAAQ